MKQDIFIKRQIEIAKKSLKMTPFAAKLMGMTHEEAREILKKYSVKK